MAEFKNYDEIKSELTVWSEGGFKVADAQKFDANTKSVIDNMVALWEKVDNAMKANKLTQDSLNQTVSDNIDSLERLRENAPEALDTLLELSTALGNDADFANTILTKFQEAKGYTDSLGDDLNAEIEKKLDTNSFNTFVSSTNTNLGTKAKAIDLASAVQRIASLENTVSTLNDTYATDSELSQEVSSLGSISQFNTSFIASK